MQRNWVKAIIALSILGIIFGWVRHADARGEQEALQLLNTVRPYMAAEQQVTLKYTGYYGACSGKVSSLLPTGLKLSRAFDIAQVNVLGESNGHPVYKVQAGVTGGAVVSLTVASPEGQHGCYVVLRLDASEEAEQAEWLKWQEEAGDALKRLGIQGQWNVMVQGYVNEQEQEQARHNGAEELVSQLARDFKGSIVEGYSDSSTISRSVATDEFQTSVQSGNHKVNLQLALHQESTTGQWRLTAGTPVITMEY
ncbi:YwmB family TATA-box binding protein [Paenibacillus sp. GCM10023248]|uniref:YwmB family TATA-box binding protein n=1 Tax=Bacillales TaxID=1385 RepID=UPI0023792227|nr:MULTISPECIES: YwmB family TATA-box binding protein [Bacillales]MDD9271554.1 YwmB family TATA-box binding protein [Paenibacillus sp. MAHUQ-63]MDR6884263.1 hypothetical protein [Bacillus sp. 3255]